MSVYVFGRESYSTLDVWLHACLVLDSKSTNIGQPPAFLLVRRPFLV